MATCLLLFLATLTAHAAPPTWWTTRGVLATNAPSTNDYAAANLGQLKWYATNALAELDANLPGGADTNLRARVTTFLAATGSNFRAVNLGTLKNIAAPFYDRLIATGYATNYPWSGSSARDYAVANLGQLKYIFNFSVNTTLYQLNLSASGASAIFNLPTTSWYPSNTTVAIQAIPSGFYDYFIDWKDTATQATTNLNPLTVTMNTNRAFLAELGSALNGLALYYPFNNYVPPGYPLTGGSAGISYATWTSAGRIGGAVSIQRSNTKNGVYPSDRCNGNVTYCAWVYWTGGNNSTLIGLDYNFNGESVGIDSSGYLTANVNPNYGWQTQRKPEQIIPQNTWQFITVTYNYGSGWVSTLWINGCSNEAAAQQYAPPGVNQTWIIGATRDTFSTEYNQWNGKIDEVMVFNGILSSNQITQLYNLTKPNFVTVTTYNSPAPTNQPTGTYFEISKNAATNRAAYVADNTPVCVPSSSTLKLSITPDYILTNGMERDISTGYLSGQIGNGTANTICVSSLTQSATVTWQWQINYWANLFSSGGCGHLSTNSGWYPTGTTITNVTAIPNYGANFICWSTGVVTALQFTNPMNVTVISPTNVTALFSTTQGWLIVNSLYATNSCNPRTSINIVNYGTNTASIALLDTHVTTQYVCTGWTGTGSVPPIGSTTTTTFNVTSSPSTINWQWSTNYMVTTNVTPSLTFGSVSNNQIWYRIGSTAILTAVQTPSSLFTNWSGSGIALAGVSTNYTLTFAVTNPIFLTANFATNGTLIVLADHGSPSPISTNYYNYGTSISAIMTPTNVVGGTQYVSRGWTGTGSVPASGSSNSFTFTFAQPSTINWHNWATNYLLTTSVTPSGYGSVSNNLGWYPLGSTATITAVQTSSSLFSNWTGTGISLAGVSSNYTLTFVVTNAVTLTANFATSGPLTVQSDHFTPNQSIPPVGTNIINYGTVVTASMPTNVISGCTQYVSLGWTGTGSVPSSGTSNTVAFTFANPSTLYWRKWATNYMVSATISNYIANPTPTLSSGDGSVSNLGWYGLGSNATIKAVPANGYMFVCWTNCSGVSLSVSTNPTVFFTVTNPVAVSAFFAVDSDSNGLPDWWELKYFGAIHNDPNADPDGDGLSNLQEYLLGTDPTKFDTDNDGLTDGVGTNVLCSVYPRGVPDPLHPGYVKGEQDYSTSPLKADALANGIGDGLAILLGRNPLVPAKMTSQLTNGCVTERFDFTAVQDVSGWTSSPSDCATVVSNLGYTSGAYVIGSTSAASSVSWLIGAVAQSIVWEDYRLKPALLDAPPVWQTVGDVNFYFNVAGELIVSNGTEWVPIPATIAKTNDWNRITVLHDYRGNAGHWAIWLNGKLAATNLLMQSGIPEYPGFRCYGGSLGQASLLDDLIVTTSINATNLSNGTLGNGLANSSAAPQLLPDVQLSGSAGNGSAQLSWTYCQTNAGVDRVDNIGCYVLYCSTNVLAGTLGCHQELASLNYDTWSGLSNNQPYTFWLTIVSKDGHFTNQSNRVTMAPQLGAIPTPPDVTSLTGFSDSSSRHISWQFNPSLAINANAIGFLVHREQDGETKLVAALPVSNQKHYRFMEAASDSPATYIVSVIDAQNRRSSGAELTLDVAADGQDEEALGMVRATFAVGKPPLHLSGVAWQGVWSGVFNGASNAMPINVSTTTINSNQVNLVIPAQPAGQQFFQAALPENQVLSVSFGLQITGANLNNDGVTVLKVKPLNSTATNNSNAAVCPVVIYQDKVYVGDLSGRFYHGGRQHNYTVAWGDTTNLYIDGNEIVLTPVNQTNDLFEVGNAFVRFGAQSSQTNIVTVWDHFALLQGITDFFPMGGFWQDPTIPNAVVGLQVVCTNFNQVSATWTPGTDADLAAYFVSVNGLKGYSAYVLGTAAPSVTLSLPIPGSYALNVQAVDTFGNMNPIGQNVPFMVNSSTSGTASASTSLATLTANGFTATGVTAVTQPGGVWLSFTNGAAYRSAPLTGATNSWGLEMTFAISPVIVTNSGFALPVMTQADILQLFSPGSSTLLSVLPESVVFGGTALTAGNMALGGSEHTIRFINDGVGLHVAMDGCYLKSLSPIALTNICIGDINPARTSKLNLKRLILVTNGTTAPNMLALTNSLIPQAVPELTLDVARCSNTNGLTLAWQPPDPSVTLIDVLYLPRRLFEAGGALLQASMPAQVLQNGLFVANTFYQQANDGDPGQVILKVVPHNLSGATGIGSARMFSENYPRTGGVASNVTVSSSALIFPSFALPTYRLFTGSDDALVINNTTAPDAFVSDPAKVCLTTNWSFEAFISPGSFNGTLFSAGPTNGPPCLTMTYGWNVLHLGDQQVALSGNSLHHLRLTFVPATNTNGTPAGFGFVNLYVDFATAPVHSNVLVAASFDTNSVLQFGNLAYAYPNATPDPLAWAEVTVATTNWNTPLQMTSDSASVTSVWRYVTSVTNVVTPVPQSDPTLGAVYLENTAVTNVTPLTFGNGTNLATCWTLQFMAHVARGVNQFIINSSDASVTIKPTLTSWATYRVVHTPEATTLFVNGDLDPAHVTVAASGTNAPVALRITQAPVSGISFRGLTWVNNAIDDTTGVLSPIHHLLYLEVASPNAQGIARSDSSTLVFADTALSELSSNWVWAFDGENNIVTNPATAQASCTVGPGSYGITLLNSQNTPLAYLNNVPVSAHWAPLGNLDAPANFTWSPSSNGFTACWTPALNQSPDRYQLQLTDPELGEIQLPNGGLVYPANLPFSVTLSNASIGQNLTLSIYAEQLLNGTPTQRSTPLVQTVSSYDTHSVLLIPNQTPVITAAAGERCATLTVANNPNDLQGYLLWQNAPGNTNGGAAAPIKFISKLGPNAVAQINALAAAAATHPLLTDDQRTALAALPSQNLLDEPLDQLTLFFFSDAQSSVSIPVGALQNPAQVDGPYTFTFDPYDDALPAPPGPPPPPNLGSRETGSNNIPASSVNTLSIQVQPMNQLPDFNGAPLRLSLSANGPVLRQTVANLATNIPAWIQNNLNPNLILLPASWSNTTLYFAGPQAVDASLVAVDLSVIGPHGEAASVAAFDTSLLSDLAGQPLVQPPFSYNATTRRVELPITGSFVCGQTLLEGANAFQLTAGDVDGGFTFSNAQLVSYSNVYGSERPSTETTVSYVKIGPRIQLLAPAVNTTPPNVVVSGTYIAPAGIRSVAVWVNGVNALIDTNSASVMNGTFWLKLNTPPANSSNTLQVVMTDLVGNVSTSTPVKLIYQATPVTVQSALQSDGTNLWLNATISGLGAASAAPLLSALTVNGAPIALADAHLTRSGTTAILTNFPVVARSGYNLFILTAGLSLGTPGAVDFTVNGAADLYLAQAGTNAPALPELLPVSPPLEIPLNGSGAAYAFNASNPFQVTYYNQSPGVDSSNVQVYVRDANGVWQDLSSAFIFTDTSATLNPNASFTIYTNAPQIKLVVHDKGLPSICATFLLAYTVLDSSQAGRPYILSVTPTPLALNQSQTVVLQGLNLSVVTNVIFRSQTNAFCQTLRILDLQANLSRSVGSATYFYDTLTVQILPPAIGTAVFDLNGFSQPQASVEIVASAVTNSLDRDGDGIPNWLDQYPDTPNTTYQPMAINVFSNMATLGYAGTSDQGHGPIVITSPAVTSVNGVTIYGETLDLWGLVPADTLGVTITFGSGLQPPATSATLIGPSSLYASSADPLAFHAAINLIKPPSGTDTITLTADRGPGNPPVTLAFNLTWEINPPHLYFAQHLNAQPILGYRSLYNRLLVDGVMREQPQYRIAGVIAHNAPLNLDTLEFRLDNEDIPSELFDVTEGTDLNGPLITFRLKDDARINIYDRWQDDPLHRLLSMDALVYGPHTLSVRIADQNGKVGLAVEPFRFDHGPKATVNVVNHVTCTPTPIPDAPNGSGDAGVSARNQVISGIDQYGLYRLAVSGGNIDSSDFAGGSANVNYYQMAYGFYPYWPCSTPSLANSGHFDAQGPVEINLSGPPTYVGGAAEQLLLNPNLRTLKVSTSLPANTSVPFSVTTTSGNQIATTPWQYSITWTGNPQSQQLDLVADLYQPASDTFATTASLTIGAQVAVALSSGNTQVYNQPAPPPTGGGGATGDGGNSSYGGNGGLVIPPVTSNENTTWGVGSGLLNPPTPPVARTATLSPGDVTVKVGDSTTYRLTISSGTCGPFDFSSTGNTTAGEGIKINGSDLGNVSASGSATLTAQFPAIPGSLAGPYLSNAGSGDHYYYNMRYGYNFKYFVDGMAIGDDRNSLQISDASYAFLPVSDPYAAVAVDARTLLAEHLIPDDPDSPVMLSFNLVVSDPLAATALDPTAYPPVVTVNGQPASPSQYAYDPEHRGTFTATVYGQSVQYGLNRLDFTIQNAVGSITHSSYFVDIADQDGFLIATPDDLYIASQGAQMGTVQQSKLYTKSVFGEFPADIQLSASGLAQSTLTLPRSGPFGRFARPFYIIDNYPAEGAVSPVPDAPVLLQQPGGTITWAAPGASPVKLYAEGVSILADNTPTHNLIPGEIAPSTFTLEADVDAKRVASAPPQFELRLYTAEGAAIDLGNGQKAIQINATPAGTIFDTLGQKFTGATPIQIVSNLTGNVRYSQVNNTPTIVLKAGEFVEANFAGLTTLAGAMIKVNIDGDCNGNDNYTDDEQLEKKCLGLLVQATDDTTASWTNNLAKVRLSVSPMGMNCGSVVLEAKTVSGGGHIKVWSANDAATASLWIDTTNGVMSKTWTLGSAETPTLAALPQWVYLQGTQTGAIPGDVTLNLRYALPDGSVRATDQMILTIVKIGLSLDFNHDGLIDATDQSIIATGGVYQFWINNDYDRLALDDADNAWYEDSVTAEAGNFVMDCNYRDALGRRAIPTKRDLQDFARVWITGIDTNLIAQLNPGAKVTLGWNSNRNAQIDLFQAADRDGGYGYLTNSGTAGLQTDNLWSPYIGRVQSTDSLQLNLNQYFKNWAGNYFIWCGVHAGSGALTLRISQGNLNTGAQIQLQDIKQMYERWTVGENPATPPTATAQLATENVSQRFQYPPSTDPNTPYILFVHGWNMETWEKDRYAEAAYKRLYWQGYQGRFGVFRWPTDYNFAGWDSIKPIGGNPDQADNFDRSERQAWLSAVGLLNALQDKYAEYNGHVYLFAHSMGNIVASEAIRLADNNRIVDTYAACQAAVSAHTYDSTADDYSFELSWHNIALSQYPATPNIYGNWFAANHSTGVRILNLYNANDFALARTSWQTDQLTKPDKRVLESGIRWDYTYLWTPTDSTPLNQFYKNNVGTPIANYQLIDIAANLQNRYEVMAFAAQAYTTALGATPIANDNIFANRSLPANVWHVDPANHKFADHFWHSAEFRGDDAQQGGFWKYVLGADVFRIQ